jgi:hypothetical protein
MKDLIQKLRDGDDGIETFRALHAAWGNSYALRPLSLLLAYKLALRSQGAILETGSGLSTIVLATAAERSGQTVTAIECDADHAKRTQEALNSLGLPNAKLLQCHLAASGFYALPSLGAFGTLVHDGPLTRKGRAEGLRALAPYVKGARILIDDVGLYAPGFVREWAVKNGHRIGSLNETAQFAIIVPRQKTEGGIRKWIRQKLRK